MNKMNGYTYHFKWNSLVTTFANLFFTHSKLCLANAIHNFKWVKNTTLQVLQIKCIQLRFWYGDLSPSVVHYIIVIAMLTDSNFHSLEVVFR